MRAVVTLGLVTLMACSMLHEQARLRFSEERLARAKELGAETRAPLPFQRYLAARGKAEAAAPASAAQSDYMSEARLWLEVAVAQAETASLSEQRLVLERDNVRLDAALLAQAAAERARDDERELAAAAAIAREEAARALARAGEAKTQRVPLAAAEVGRAARALVQRAELILLALPSQTDAAALAALNARIGEARALLGKAPDQALKLADQTLFEGLALAGTLRVGEASASAASKASLAEALTLLGAELGRNERGLVANLGASLSGPSTAPKLERLCSVISAYPLGSVEVQLPGRATEPELLRTLTQHGCSAARLRVHKGADSRAASVLFTAY
jgi:hypothetical protein